MDSKLIKITSLSNGQIWRIPFGSFIVVEYPGLMIVPNGTTNKKGVYKDLGNVAAKITSLNYSQLNSGDNGWLFYISKEELDKVIAQMEGLP